MRWLTCLSFKFNDRYTATRITGLKAPDQRVPFKDSGDASTQTPAANAVDKPYTGESLQRGLVKVFLNGRNRLGQRGATQM